MPYNPAEVVEIMLNKALDKAAEASSKSDELFDKALDQVGNPAQMGAASLLSLPASTGLEPKVYIPEVAEGASVELFNSWWEKVNESLFDKMEWYINRFFPNECPYLQRAQLWICKTLAEGGTGMNQHVEDMIWQRDRARLLKEAKRAEGEAVSGFAARGFPMPPGMLAGALERIQLDTLDKTAQASRDVAIKQAEIEIENVRFAVDKAIDLYTKVMGAVGEFMKALISSAGMSAQLIPSITDSQSKLISAAADYYRARISVQELMLKAHSTNAGFVQEASKENQDAIMQAMKMKVDAAIEAARALATEAAAALNAMHASASISGTASNSVDYRYGGEVSGDVPPKTTA
jgi:hypothetical protein